MEKCRVHARSAFSAGPGNFQLEDRAHQPILLSPTTQAHQTACGGPAERMVVCI